MFNRGLVAMSADPFHYGHLDLVLRAKHQCQKLFVLVSNNDDKKGSYTFTLQERLQMVRQTIGDVPDIEVITPPTFVLADTYLHYNCDVLFRGIRNATDYQYERSQMEYHKLIYPQMRIEYLQSLPKWDNVSSSIVKAFVRHHIDVADFVPMPIKKQLERRIAKQYRIGITGQMATGKSWVADMLVKRINDIKGNLVDRAGLKFPAFARAVKLDEIIRQVYEDDIPGAQAMRLEIEATSKVYGTSVMLPDGKIDRKALGKLLFSGPNSATIRSTVQTITKPLIHMRFRQALNDYTGIVFFEWAQLAEMNMGDWTNYDVIVVDSPDRERFIQSREIPEDVARDREKTQWTADRKAQRLEENARLAGCGTIVRFSNPMKSSRGGRGDANFNALLRSVSEMLR